MMLTSHGKHTISGTAISSVLAESTETMVYPSTDQKINLSKLKKKKRKITHLHIQTVMGLRNKCSGALN